MRPRGVETILALAFLLLAVPLSVSAQNALVRGTVTDDEGLPIAGATVMVRGADAGALTQADGTYTLSLTPGTYTLEARMLGFRPATRTVTLAGGGAEVVDFTLSVSAIQLTDVVASVTAGETTRRQMGVDVASINVADQIDRSVVTSLSDLLNARAGNVTISQAGGEVGAGSRIRVRGINSLTQGNNPLVIIDGVRASNSTNVGINRGQTFSRFDDLDPSTIDRIQVVKGPAALALYGSEAGSGVIIIDTKSGAGARDGMEFSLSVEQGALWDTYDFPDNLADVTPYVTGPDDPRLNGWPVETHPLTGQVFVVDNPFEDPSTSPFRTGRISETAMQLTGRSGDVVYFTSLGYDNKTGALPSNDLERLNFRANFEVTPNENLSIGVNSGYVNSTINLPKSGNNTSGYFANGVSGIPMSSRNDAGQCLGNVLGLTDDAFCDKDGNVRAGFHKIEPIISRENLERFMGSLRISYSPFSWLTNSATVGTDVVDQVFHDAIPYDPDIPFSFAAGGEYFRTRLLRRHVTADLSSTANYELAPSLRASTGVGAQYFQNYNEEIACEGRVFVNDQATACDAGVSLRGFSDLSEKVELGAFLQQQFSYNDYLFVTGALRVDDNSALGAEEPAIYSPSFNTSLVLSDMPFWSIDPGTITELRLRGAWGTASKSPVQYAAERTYGIVRLGRPGGQVVAGLSPENPGNPDLGPERSSEIEVGFDAGLLEDRLGFQFTYFNRATRDAIVNRPVPPSSGFAQSKWVNLGELTNVGYEASLHAELYRSDNIDWTATFAMSGTKAKITDLGGEDAFAGFRVGYAPGALESCVITAAERDASGNIIPESIQREPGTLGDGSCRRVVGQPTPTNEQSLLSSVTLWNDLEVSVVFDRAAGNLAPSGLLSSHEPGRISGRDSRFGRIWAYRQLDLTPIEQAYLELDETEGSHDLFFYQKGDFIKFRELMVNYRLPSSLAQRFRTSAASLYVGARNLVTWTDYMGIDPEVNQRGARDEVGTNDYGAFAPPLMVFSGLRVTF